MLLWSNWRKSGGPPFLPLSNKQLSGIVIQPGVRTVIILEFFRQHVDFPPLTSVLGMISAMNEVGQNLCLETTRSPPKKWVANWNVQDLLCRKKFETSQVQLLFHRICWGLISWEYRYNVHLAWEVINNRVIPELRQASDSYDATCGLRGFPGSRRVFWKQRRQIYHGIGINFWGRAKGDVIWYN